MNIANVVATPASFYMIERIGRRSLLLYGAAAMCVCEFLVAIVGTATPAGSKAS